MSKGLPVILRLLESSIYIAYKAGQIIRNVLKKGDLGIVEKSKNDLQTEADRMSQQFIISSLLKKFPNISIIGEEGSVMSKSDFSEGSSDSTTIATNAEELMLKPYSDELNKIEENKIVVWVDPLDGTAEYTQGLVEHVTVLIGFAVDGKPVGGVIHQPYFLLENDELGRTIWGLQGMGLGGFTPASPPENKLIITTTRSHSNEKVEDALKILKPDEVLRVGGAGYKVLLLLEGKAHAYVFPTSGCKKWDTCAPEAILSCAGGLLTDVDGVKYNYCKDVEHINAKGVLAAVNVKFHEMCFEALNKK